ncbi:SRPBCC family protein [Companilactobacillus huachuanensis]|uniref:SRPBCC family protein n=1 Tax=Companilactobacillus huachuanensis TaxID=2559914 RepID=A0ABW1RLV7_9LACO|nr:SRPBCC family protein [Companilactobacillus huachuanensis]
MLKIHVQQSIKASPQKVFSWLANSENYRHSKLVFYSKWQDINTSENAIRQIITIGGWFQEKIKTITPDELITYDIQQSFPAMITRGTGKITIRTSKNHTTIVDWQLSLNLKYPSLTNIIRKIVTSLYADILLTALYELEMTDK